MKEFDCQACGACCVSLHGQEAFADLVEADFKRLGKRFVRAHVISSSTLDRLAAAIDGKHHPDASIKTKWAAQKTGPLKGSEACVCSALRGSVMSRVGCSVYKNRPKVCREAVKPGDKTCKQIRRMMGDLISDLEDAKTS